MASSLSTSLQGLRTDRDPHNLQLPTLCREATVGHFSHMFCDTNALKGSKASFLAAIKRFEYCDIVYEVLAARWRSLKDLVIHIALASSRRRDV